MVEQLQSIFDNARQETFDFNGTRITVRESLGADYLDKLVFRRFLREQWDEKHYDPKTKKTVPISDVDWNRMANALWFIMRTVKVKGELPSLKAEGKPPRTFKLPSRDNPEEWWEACWHFMVFPFDLIEKWDDALGKVNSPEPSPEANPGEGKNTTNT